MLGELIKQERSPGHRLLSNTISYIKRQTEIHWDTESWPVQDGDLFPVG